MINSIRLLQNIGTFNSDDAASALPLKQANLIYADNARGKTTLAAILRSLATGNSVPISERHRLGSQHSPKVVLECETEPQTVIFQEGNWNQTLPNLKVYDDFFVDGNVYSGLDVDAQHRQNLHQLILGEQGLALNHLLADVVSRISKHNANLEQKSKAIPVHLLGGLSADDFCNLVKIQDIDEKIKEAEREVKVASDQATVATGSKFGAVVLPDLDSIKVKEILSTGLPELDRAAEARVQEHLNTLGEGGESWVAEGVSRVGDGDRGTCPFCGQEITGLDLIAHYSTYFSEGYANLKQNVTDMVAEVESRHTGGVQATFERSMGRAKELSQFWSTYCDVPPIEVDTETVTNSWTAARETLVQLLKAKQAAPLESFELSPEQQCIIDAYNVFTLQMQILSEALVYANNDIQEVLQRASSADLQQLQTELAKLKATKARFSNEVAPLCEDYLQEKEAKAQAEIERADARESLEQYRANIFPTLQTTVNYYLQRFNAGFRIESLKPSNIGGGSGSTCTYNVIVNNTPITVSTTNNPIGEPSFRNSLSSGDRNTLALALFFSSLDQDPSLANSIVVIDDPMSSLDEHRSLTTVQEVRKLAGRVGQLVVLSHSKRFLCEIWSGLNQKECRSLEIAQSGEESTIRAWDVSQDAITEHDRRHFQLQQFVGNQVGEKKEIAQSIRPHLEGFLRVVCPASFPPGKLLGPFIGECCAKLGKPDEVLNEIAIGELKDLVEYGNRFHHDTNPAWIMEDINATELLGFVKRTLSFAGPPRV